MHQAEQYHLADVVQQAGDESIIRPQTEDGRQAFHELSALDASRYDPKDTDRKWEQTERLHPVRCETLAKTGYRCPHLDDDRCNGAPAPSYFLKYQYMEIL